MIFLSSVKTNAQTNVPAKFKTEPVIVANESASSPTDASNINAKAIKSFNRNFRTSATVRWFDQGDLIQANFVDNAKQHRVFYRPNGKWFRTLITYQPQLLNSHIASLVKENYSNYEIKCVTEVEEGMMHCYFINIETAKDFKQVIVYQDEVFVHQQFKKQ